MYLSDDILVLVDSVDEVYKAWSMTESLFHMPLVVRVLFAVMMFQL